MALTVLGLVGACSGALDRPGYDGSLPESADRHTFYRFCGSADTPLLIEIDYVQGERPTDYAARYLERVVRRVCGKRAPVTVKIDEAINHDARALQMGEIAELASQNVSWLVEAQRRGWRYAYVLYVPYIADIMRGKGSRGYASWITAQGQRIPFACIAKAKIGEYAFLWATERKLERMVLLHEMGHLLGLRGVHWGHCHRPTCIMYDDLDVRFLFANFLAATFLADLPSDFCEICRNQFAGARKTVEE